MENNQMWLSTSDIDKVMEQYEDAYPKFKYMGANPIDFDLKLGNTCVLGDICSLDVENKRRKIVRMVFNTDNAINQVNIGFLFMLIWRVLTYQGHHVVI